MKNYVIANNDECLEEMQKTAQQLGYTVCRMQIFGDIKDAVKEDSWRDFKR